ncbi:MAG: hypothetical protein ABSH29_03015 [Acidimicrobiales bacterium]
MARNFRFTHDFPWYVNVRELNVKYRSGSGAAESAALAERLGMSSSALFEALQGNPLASQYTCSGLR